MLVDTHCHLDFPQYDEDRPAVVARALENGVERIIIPAVDLETIPRILKMAEATPQIYAAVGVHPNSTGDLPADWLYQLEEYADHPKVVAIGEIGLDYYWDRVAVEVQKEAFAAQMELAFDLALPIIIHNREASADVLDMVKQSSLRDIEKPGVFHSFLADWDTAVEAVDLGYFLGFTGPVTYKKNDALREIAKEMPIDRLVVETDGPYLSPQVRRGKRNEPAYVKFIADFIGELRGLDSETIANLTTENAACLFGRKINA